MIINFRNTTFWGVAADISSSPSSDKAEVVLSGKSNVGKSSLINALADNHKLARVSSEPGKTRLVIYFNVDDRLFLTDLPGYGFAKAPKSIKEQYSKLADQYFGCGRPIRLVLHLIDIRHEPSVDDIRMIQYMDDNHIPYFIVFNKADKFSNAQRKKRISELENELGENSSLGCFAISSEKKEGIDNLRDAIDAHLFPDSGIE